MKIKSDKELFNVSPSECLKIYSSISKNADNLWSGGYILAKKTLFGPAISLNIISIEEYIKCLILLMDGNGFELRRAKGISRFFKEHGVRYYMAFILLLFYLIAEDLISFLESTLKDPLKAAMAKELSENQALIEQMGMVYFQQKLRKLKSELPFFVRLDESRQLGFYCDYGDSFHTPDNITIEDYEENRMKLRKVRTCLKELIKFLESDEKNIKEYKSNILKYFKDNHIYDRLSDTLTSNRTAKLFENLESWFLKLEV